MLHRLPEKKSSSGLKNHKLFLKISDMINKTTTIFITLLVLTSCVFGQSMKLTKDVIKIIKERDEIKNTKTKALKEEES